MAIALVTGQLATVDFGAVTSQAISLPNTPATGNFVVLCVANGGSGATISAKDANNNNYTHVTSSPFSANGQEAAILILANVPANGHRTITITASPSIIGDAWIAEFSGVVTATPTETTATAAIAATTSITTPSLTTTNDGDLLVACVATNGGITAAGSPWTGMSAFPTAQGHGAEYMIQSTHGTQGAAFTQSSATAAGIIAAFKAAAAAAGAPATPTLPMLGV